jgi:hypothetical protein
MPNLSSRNDAVKYTQRQSINFGPRKVIGLCVITISKFSYFDVPLHRILIAFTKHSLSTTHKELTHFIRKIKAWRALILLSAVHGISIGSQRNRNLVRKDKQELHNFQHKLRIEVKSTTDFCCYHKLAAIVQDACSIPS